MPSALMAIRLINQGRDAVENEYSRVVTCDGNFYKDHWYRCRTKRHKYSGDLARSGDAILISGNIGDHGIEVLSKRENFEFETMIESDSAALHSLVDEMIKAVPQTVCVIQSAVV